MHSLLILVLILDALIAISSILNLVNMVRVNLLVEEKQAQALTVQLVRVCKTSAGKGGLLSSWFGVYACPREIGTGEFTSTNPYGSPEAVPKATTVVPMKAPGCWSTAISELTWAVVWCRCGLRQEAFLCCWQRLSACKAFSLDFSA